MELCIVIGVILLAFIGAYVSKRVIHPTEKIETIIVPGAAAIILTILIAFVFTTLHSAVILFLAALLGFSLQAVLDEV